jgi:hypothetical protein
MIRGSRPRPRTTAARLGSGLLHALPLLAAVAASTALLGAPSAHAMALPALLPEGLSTTLSAASLAAKAIPMLDQTMYLASLAVGSDNTPLVLHLVAALLPAVFIGWAAIKGSNKFLATVGFASLNAMAFYAASKLTEGGYNYWLYTICRPLHDPGMAGMVSPGVTDQFFLYFLPALIHGLLAPLAGAVVLAVARQARKRA